MEFKLNEKDSEKIKTWFEEHSCEFSRQGAYLGAIGGRITYLFTPTSLGTVVKVRCACGEEIDITEYDW